MAHYGTSHFVSQSAAINYYFDYGYDDALAAVLSRPIVRFLGV